MIGHVPVLLKECVELLAPLAGQTVLDCTAGRGGHASALAVCAGLGGRVVLMDLDKANLEFSLERVRGVMGRVEDDGGARLVGVHGTFAEAPRRMKELGLQADVVLADLGFASNQMDDGARGLSFMRDGPLDMRLNPLAPITAAELVNTMPERDLAEMLRDFGEEPNAGRIARGLVARRAEKKIETTGELSAAVRESLPRMPPTGLDPSTRTFQALRIAVNDELGSLDRLLAAVGRSARGSGKSGDSADWLAPGARIGVISFHSLEDRRVKQAFGGLTAAGLAEGVGRQPTVPGEGEVHANPRSRSAKLRVVKLAR